MSSRELVFLVGHLQCTGLLTWIPWKMLGGTWTPFILAALLTIISASATRPWERSHRGDSGICLPPPMITTLQRWHRSYGTYSLCHIMRGGDESCTQSLEDVDVEGWELKVFTTRGAGRAGWEGRWPAADSSSLAGSRLSAAAACSQRRSSGRRPEMRRSPGRCGSRSQHLVFKWVDKKDNHQTDGIMDRKTDHRPDSGCSCLPRMKPDT